MTLLCVAYCRPKPPGPREAAPGFRLCWVCKDKMAANLRDLIALDADLEQALTRAMAVGEKVSGTPGHGVELVDKVAAVRWQIHHDLVTTVRLVMEERGLTVIDARQGIAGMALWLINHVDWLAAHPSAAERASEASSWPGMARSAIHPNPPRYVRIGPCVRDNCTGELNAVVRPQDSLLPSAIVCTWWSRLDDKEQAQLIEDGVEPHQWSADQWHALGRQVEKRRTA